MSTRPDSFMPFYIGDYLADTSHLSAAEHGAYMLLIMHYWRSGVPLLDDDGVLRRIARMSSSEWKASRKTIRAFFDEAVLDCERVLAHARIEKELTKAGERYKAKKEASDAAVAAKKAKRDAALAAAIDPPNIRPTIVPDVEPNVQRLVNQPQPQPQPQSSNEEKNRSAPSAREPIPPLPSWVPKEAWDAFVEMRVRIKAPLTARAVKLTLGALERFRASGQDPSAVLEQSVMRSYRGLFPINTERRGNSKPRESPLQQAHRIANELANTSSGHEIADHGEDHGPGNALSQIGYDRRRA